MRRRTVSGLIADILFPAICPVCGDIPPAGLLICPECAKKLPWIRGRRCAKCGKELEGTGPFCSDCRVTPHSFRQGASIFRYDDVIRKALSKLKYKGCREFGEVLGELISGPAGLLIAGWNPDAVVPVPVHPSKLKSRGYNQAEVLWKCTASGCGIPMLPGLLERRRKTEALKRLTREERREEVGRAFHVPSGAKVPKKVLVADDIYTTGATADACASALLRAGASEVFFIAAASGGGLQ